MSITFSVSNVDQVREPLRFPASDALPRFLGRPVEALGAGRPFLPVQINGFVDAVGLAYAEHRPLAISPDAVWLTIAQGFAIHVKANAERLRGKFVRHDGQATLAVNRDDFVLGSAENPWPEVFGTFSDAIAEHIGRQRDLVVCDFSTTGAIERAASEIVLLDAMQRYFRYEVHTLCGIPEITLEGTIEDWRSIRRRGRALEEYELGWWTKALAPLLDELLATAEGRVDKRFWESFFKPMGGSGGPYVQGWMNVLFPYLRVDGAKAPVQNPWLGRWRDGLGADFGGGATEAEIPSGVSTVPFIWHYLGTKLPMRFLAGFVGVAQDQDTMALRPAIGWAVRRDPMKGHVIETLALMAGRVTSSQKLTLQEVDETIEAIETIAGRFGISVVCAPCGNFAEGALDASTKLTCFFVVGIRVLGEGREGADASELSSALENARKLPSFLWDVVAERLPGPMTDAPALHLIASGRRSEGTLKLGDKIVAYVSVVHGSLWRIVDISPLASQCDSQYVLEKLQRAEGD